ncbi:MAG TPA: DUF4139 domain-containing protein [Candidatus Bathyarchaeia archaeon]|nr:DUF4139 domain-containing protein [Candidatus Bathyarchaeia archaeon]
MMKRTIALALVLALWCAQLAGAAPQAITRDSQKDVMVTIYNGNLGLVKDTREVSLESGMLEVQFADVAALIDPTSVHLKSLTDPAALRILEQNYEYDLLTSAKLLEKYVGKKVRLYQSNGSYQEATLLSTNGPIYEINGQIHMGHSGQVVLPALPDNLVSRPTLVWLLRNAKAAAQRVEASYLTGGINWKADYVMVINAADTRSDLTGWVTIDNKSGSTYSNAALKLVAGDINRAQDRNREGRLMDMAAKAASAAMAERDFKSEGFFEYHLYTLDGRTTLKDNQTKQLSLMSASDVPVDKHFVYYGAADYYRTQSGVPMSNQKVGVYLELKNTKENRLGLPIPKGRVRVYKADASGSQQLIGEDWIDHTPKDEKIKIKMGEAFDVVGQRTQKDWRRIASNLYEVEWEISLRNHKKEAITVEVNEPMPGDWEVLRESHPHEKIQAFTAQWKIPVPTEGEAKLSYRIRVRF